MFWTRLFSGIALLAIALVTIILNGPILLITLWLVSMEAYTELVKATGACRKDKKWDMIRTIGVLFITLYYIAVFIQNKEAAVAVVVLSMIAYMFGYVFSFPGYISDQVMAAFTAFFYGPVLLSFIYWTRNLPIGAYLVWMIFISSWGCDTCAYCVGVLFGKHKMTPVLSPHKSVEGAIGGVVGAAILGGLYAGILVGPKVGQDDLIWVFALIGAAGGLISMVGDLAASAIKRNHEIKDYAKLIPGHGGIMDRFDSVIFTAPIIYFLSVWLLA
ncbi:MAG: phosphatidate cytidylyltransferase [Lachnospiraceae bacterium]|nr:phosphatidate cytidylyltransferase [Lachnospiraceae bacterium]